MRINPRLMKDFAWSWLVVLLAATIMAAGAFGPFGVPDHAHAHADPSRPVVGMFLNVYKYPELQTTKLACDGTDVINFSAIRIEAHAVMDDSPEWRNVNAEHWTARVTYRGPDPQGSTNNQGVLRTVKLWDNLWHNQNTPGGGQTMEFTQSNHYRPLDGFQEITVDLIGSITGNTFQIVCPFTVDIP